jgi:hypothetical protein
MNERIQQLAEHSLITVLKLVNDPVVKDGCYIVSPDRLEYFANQIVKECANICLINDPGDVTYIGQQAAEKYIKQHFGVE